MKIKAQTLLLNKANKEDTLKMTWLKKIYFNHIVFNMSSFMALFKIIVWALIFITKLRFPPGSSIVTIKKTLMLYFFFHDRCLLGLKQQELLLLNMHSKITILAFH